MRVGQSSCGILLGTIGKGINIDGTGVGEKEGPEDGAIVGDALFGDAVVGGEVVGCSDSF